MERNFRKLTPEEISQLQEQQCICEAWNQIELNPEGNVDTIRNVHFAGPVRIGILGKSLEMSDGTERRSGIYHATLSHCTLGDHVYISNVRGSLSHYIIGDEVIIEDIYQLVTRGISRFGNGIRVPVLNESGGREVLIFDRLSAQTAYIMALYRHQRGTLAFLSNQIEQYARSVSSDMGEVGRGTRIVHCGRLENLRIGEFARLEGVLRATEGTINSTADAPTLLGDGTLADEFIIATGSTVQDGAILKRCFVGQGCLISKAFSAENSLFFSNCEALHGEACSLFAGPHTVTHHRSTLLIACFTSFFNAGSGSNQSNHMYKLGPVHQGILGRGSKTCSDSYLTWPARTAPFTLIRGRHTKSFDTSSLPFSHLVEKDGISYLVPAASLQNVGILRDLCKWPIRDRRAGEVLHDNIDFDLFHPFMISMVLRGETLLKKLKQDQPEADFYDYQGVRIKKNALERGIILYSSFVERALARTVSGWIDDAPDGSLEALDKALALPGELPAILPEWLDIGGMYAPVDAVEKLCTHAEKGQYKSLEQWEQALGVMEQNREEEKQTYLLCLLRQRFGMSSPGIQKPQLVSLLERWKKWETELERMLHADAAREFFGSSLISYGVDGMEEIVQADFEQVRGSMETHPFLSKLRKEIAENISLANLCVEKMQQEPVVEKPQPIKVLEAVEETPQPVPVVEPIVEKPQPTKAVDPIFEKPQSLPVSETKLDHEINLAEKWEKSQAPAHPPVPLADLASGIGLNDKFLFTRELFKSNPAQFKSTIAYLNEAPGLEEAMQYIESQFDWNQEDPTVKKFVQLVKRRHHQ